MIQSATIVNGNGEQAVVGVEDLMLSYRSSFFPDDWIITSITFRTEPSSREQIGKILEEQKQYRMQSQPYNERTGGVDF